MTSNFKLQRPHLDIRVALLPILRCLEPFMNGVDHFNRLIDQFYLYVSLASALSQQVIIILHQPCNALKGAMSILAWQLLL